MIEGRLPNFKIIARANMHQIIQQEIMEQQRQLETNSNRVRDENNYDYKISERISKNRDHPIFSQANISFDDHLGKINFNDQLIKPSYLMAVQNIPLPSKELEEKILEKHQRKLNDYYEIKLFVQGEMFMNKVNDENPNPKKVYVDNGIKNKQSVVDGQIKLYGQNQQNNDQNENNKNNNCYLFNEQNKKDEEIIDFMSFAQVTDKNTAEKYVQMFPGDTNKQVQEYQKDRKSEEEFKNNISIFKSKTDASGAVAIQYLNKYQNVKEAIMEYQQKQKKEALKETIIEFKNIRNCEQSVAEKYINEHQDLIIALEKYDVDQQKKNDIDQQNKYDALIKQMISRTGIDKQAAQSYLEMGSWEIDVALQCYQQFGQ